MTAFGKLIRTTAFRLTLVYLFLSALFAALLLGYFVWNTRRLNTEQITTTVNAETGEISRISLDGGDGAAFVLTIENWKRQGPAPTSTRDHPGAGDRRQCRPACAGRWRPPDGRDLPIGVRRTGHRDHHALRGSPNRPAVDWLIGAIWRSAGGCSTSSVVAAQWSVLGSVVLGLGGGIRGAAGVAAYSMRMTGTTQRIIAGDLSGRSRTQRRRTRSSSAENLNATPERIELFMMGPKEVDNIVYDQATRRDALAIAPRRFGEVRQSRPNTATLLNGPSRNPTV